jgi:hypothetical protein
MFMEWNFLAEQNRQGLDGKVVQTVENVRKKRSQADKIGKHKYELQRIDRILAEIEGLRGEMRVIRNALENAEFLRFSKPQVQVWAFADKVDEAIFDLVKASGDPGVFPKDVAADVNKLGEYALKYYHVARRIVRMNNRLHLETGECLFEKRGHRWALTRFAFDVYGATESEVEVARSVEESKEEACGLE